MTTVLTPILIIALLIVLNGLFVAAEFAIIASRRPRLEQLSKDGRRGAQAVQHIVSSSVRQDRYIAVAQLGITLATIGLGMYGEPSIAAWLYSPIEHTFGISETLAHTIGTIIAVAIMTYFHVAIGEMIPKALALQSPEQTALGVIGPMRVMRILFYPLVTVLNAIATGFLKLLRIPVEGNGARYTAQELARIVNESFEGGELEDAEKVLIANIFDFGEREVYQVMTPRRRIKGLPLGASLDEVKALVETTAHSRFPVFEGDLDHIVGVLHVRDFIKEQTLAPESFRLRKLLRRAPRVPEGMPAENLLAAFKRLKVHLAVVIDEFGGTAGIVTMEDLLEEVVGETSDENESTPRIEEVGEGELRVQGTVPLEELNERYDLSLASETAETVAGLVVDELTRPPQIGDEVETEGVRLRAEAIDGLAIETVAVYLSEAQWQHVLTEREAREAEQLPDDPKASSAQQPQG
jgi:CBS domain containing-hemolysin-like protein